MDRGPNSKVFGLITFSISLKNLIKGAPNADFFRVMNIFGSVKVQKGHRKSLRVMTSSWGQLGSNKWKFRRSTSTKSITPLEARDHRFFGIRRRQISWIIRIYVQRKKFLPPPWSKVSFFENFSLQNSRIVIFLERRIVLRNSMIRVWKRRFRSILWAFKILEQMNF